MLSKALVIAISLFLSLAASMELLASPPDSGTMNFWLPGEPFVDCGDFQVLDDVLVRGAWRDFKDKEGNVVRSFIHFDVIDDIYHQDFPDGIRVDGKASINHQYYYPPHKITGLINHIVLPGYGPVYFEAGQLVGVSGEWVFMAGANKDWSRNEYDADAICDFFAEQ